MADFELIWRPVFYFMNAVEINSIQAIGADSTKSLWLRKDGLLFISSVIKVTLTCNMHYSRFPFDEQTCFLNIRNGNGGIDHVQFGSLGVQGPNKEKLMASELPLMNSKLNFDVAIKSKAIEVYVGEIWEIAMAKVEFSLRRNANGIMRVTSGYILPTNIFAFMSLIAFFINPDNVSTK